MKVRKAALLLALSFSTPGAFSFAPASPAFDRKQNGASIAAQRVSARGAALQMSETAAETLMKMDLSNTSAEKIESLVRAEYLAWAQTFGKVPDFERRYPTFSKNFMLQLQFDRENNNGNFVGLNEYGDMTQEEYNETVKLREATQQSIPDNFAINNENPVDAKLLSEYKSWADTYNKEESKERFDIFKENFLANMKHYQETGDYYVLNEYADMTDEEFDRNAAIAMEKSSADGQKPALEPPPLAPLPSAAGSSYMSFLGGGDTNADETAPNGTPTVGSSNSYLESMNAGPPAAQRPGIPSYTDHLGQSTFSSNKQSSYMPQSYNEPMPSANSYLDSMDSTGFKEVSPAPHISYLEPLTPAGPAFLDDPNEGPSYADTIKSQISTSTNSNTRQPYSDTAEYKPAGPTTYLDDSTIMTPSITYAVRSGPRKLRTSSQQLRKGMRSDQAAPMSRISPDPGPQTMNSAAAITFEPLTNPISKPNALSCDQSTMMRERETFLPRASNPVVKRSCLESDQSKNFQFFFTGRLCAVDPFTPIPKEQMRSPYSDQERIDNEMRRTQLYFQRAKGNALLYPS